MRPRGPISLLALAIVATFVAYNSTSRSVAAALPPRPERHVLGSHFSLPAREVRRSYVRAVEAVTVADIQQVAQAYLVGGTTVGLRPAG